MLQIIRRQTMKRHILFAILFCTGAVIVALAQGGATGAISGVVQDVSGAFVPGAQIRIVNQATGSQVRTLASNADGSFSALLLPIGTYEVHVHSGNFAESRISDV